jgi:two-component system, LytTR family, sensor kinase
MDKRRNHIIFWVGYFVYYFTSMYIAFKDSSPLEVIISRNLFVFFSILISFYSLINIIFPHTLGKKKYYLLIFEVLCLVALFLFIHYIIYYYLNIIYPTKIPNSTVLTSLARGLMIVERGLCFATPFWFFKNFVTEMQQTFENERVQNNLKKTILNAELMGLKNQINPHFFYNILNFLYSHALPITTKLSNAILILSDMMRYAIRENTDEGHVSLKEEVTFIQNYIQLENLHYPRYGKVNMIIGGNLQYRRVIPLTFQPILDFSYKYGNKIFFNLEVKEDKIFFVSNCNYNNYGMDSINSYFQDLKLKKTNSYEYFLQTEHDKFSVELQVKL